MSQQTALPSIDYLIHKWQQYMNIPLTAEHASVLVSESVNIIRNLQLLERYFTQYAAQHQNIASSVQPYLLQLKVKIKQVENAANIYRTQLSNPHTTITTPSTNNNPSSHITNNNNNNTPVLMQQSSANMVVDNSQAHRNTAVPTNTPVPTNDGHYVVIAPSATASSHPIPPSSTPTTTINNHAPIASASSSSYPSSSLSTSLSSLGHLQLPGTRYAIDRTLRQTLFGKVKLAHDTQNNNIRVAIKLSQQELLARKITRTGKQVAEDPVNEILILRTVSQLPPQPSSSVINIPTTPLFYPGQENICRLIDERADSKYIWTILQFCGGGEFFDFVAQRGRLPEAEAKHYFRQLMHGVYFLHRLVRVCHLDLSLENMLLDDDQKNAYICDFGLTRPLDCSTIANDDPRYLERRIEAIHYNKPGKIGYMAPELFAGQPFYGTLADIYCCGVILFISITGVPPYQAPTPADDRFKYIYSGQIRFLLRDWKLDTLLSESAYDLLSHLLCPPERRYAIEQILLHPFLRDSAGEELIKPNGVYAHMASRGITINNNPIIHPSSSSSLVSSSDSSSYRTPTSNNSGISSPSDSHQTSGSSSMGEHRTSGSFKRSRSNGNEGDGFQGDDDDPGM